MTHPTPSPTLLLDASSASIYVGLLDGGTWLAFEHSKEQALESLFDLTQLVLKKTNTSLTQVRRFIFCEGPGSVLGVRLSAMALRTWRTLPEHRQTPIYAYNSMHFAHAIVQQTCTPQGDYAIITESRMKRWNTLIQKKGTQASFQEIHHEDIDTLPPTRYYFAQREHSAPPPNTLNIAYHPKAYPTYFNDLKQLHLCQEPDAFLPETPTYKTWSAQRHRATP